MRTSLTLLLSLLLLSLASSAGRSEPRPPGKGKAKPAAKVAEAPLTWEVKGRGETLEEAEKDALAKARRLIEAYLRSRQPPLHWSPPLDYIREHLVTNEPQRHEEDDEPIVTEKRVYTMKCWSWTVSVAPQKLVEQDRQARSGERMLLAGKVTGGLVLLLVLATGYLRLDEWTRGAYTRWLRVALVSAAVGVGAGLVLLA